LTELLLRQKQALADNAAEARSLVQGVTVSHTGVADRAAWVQVARVLLNLDELITRE
jgi:hypothetical protein